MWVVENKAGEQLRITVEEIEHDSSHELGVDPGLVKDGVEAHLQALLAEHVELLGAGYTLVRREYMTPIGPVDLLCRDEAGPLGGGRDQAARRDRRRRAAHPLPRPAQPRHRARTGQRVCSPHSRSSRRRERWPTDRGIRCLTLDYDQMRGMDSDEFRLF